MIKIPDSEKKKGKFKHDMKETKVCMFLSVYRDFKNVRLKNKTKKSY